MDSRVLREVVDPHLGDVVILFAIAFAVVCLARTFWLTLFTVKENPEIPETIQAREIIDRMTIILLSKTF
jgi:hypothetical protein